MKEKKIEINLDVEIPMRDGVKLHAVLYKPALNEKLPALLLRSPYAAEFPDYSVWGPKFCESGYAVVMQDIRGRLNSDGECTPYIQEINDGLDTQKWVAKQSWCNGCIGTFGISYSGFTQVLTAPLNNPNLMALVPVGNQVNNYGHLRYNGILQLENTINWIWWGNKITQHVPERLINWEKLYKVLPLNKALDGIADRPYYKKVIKNETYNNFWKSADLTDKYNKISVPAYFITGWYDNLVHETFKNFIGWKTKTKNKIAKEKTKLLVGPWYHYNLGKNTKFGDITFGKNSTLDIIKEHIIWFDQRLKNHNTGIDNEKPIKIFVMGLNKWRGESEWPLLRTKYTKYYLHSGGNANTRNGDGILNPYAPNIQNYDSFTYNPENPVPTLGGQSQLLRNCGPRNRYDLEMRDDILVYSTRKLKENTEITGKVEIILYASASTLDTDFTATLVDVHPDNKCINITEGIIRAKFRNSYSKQTLIKPNKIYKYKFPLWETSNLFKKGHKIRIEISSSNFPKFDRNLNTGKFVFDDDEIKTSTQKIFHNKHHPSHVIFPIIPIVG